VWPYLVDTFSVKLKFQDRAECGNMNMQLQILERLVSLSRLYSLFICILYYFLFSADRFGKLVSARKTSMAIGTPSQPQIPFTISTGSLYGLDTAPGDQPLINNYTETQVSYIVRPCNVHALSFRVAQCWQGNEVAIINDIIFLSYVLFSYISPRMEWLMGTKNGRGGELIRAKLYKNVRGKFKGKGGYGLAVTCAKNLDIET
jgi:hypothetical protein